MSSAVCVSLSGANVSTMTASSCVSFAPIEASVVPGCGPCGMPPGWSVKLPRPIPLRDMKSPSA